jgi:hypothetical protein
MTHTAGPWHADEHMRIVGANGDVICDVDPFDALDAAQANLRLIAAAPELLEAGKDLSFVVTAWLSNPGIRPDLDAGARRALQRWLDAEPKPKAEAT